MLLFNIIKIIILICSENDEQHLTPMSPSTSYSHNNHPKFSHIFKFEMT
jgi:hypothetical protein